MAKMFYTLEEAANKLGIDEEAVKRLAEQGDLQQFRDRDKLMFKNEEIDALVAERSAQESAVGMTLSGGDDETSPLSTDIPVESDIPIEEAGGTSSSAGPEDSIELRLDDTGSQLPLSETGSLATGDVPMSDTGVMETLDGEPSGSGALNLADTAMDEDARQATGVSVFDADEVEPSDPSAQTVVTGQPTEMEDISLDSVGSGSGLLDLTREADETSLGIEDIEIFAGAEGSDAKLDSAAGSSGVLEGAVATGPGESAAASSGLEAISAPIAEQGELVDLAGPTPVMAQAAEVWDPVWSGGSIGFLGATAIVLVLTLIIAVAALAGVPHQITVGIATNVGLYAGVMGGACLVFGIVGLIVGKMVGK